MTTRPSGSGLGLVGTYLLHPRESAARNVEAVNGKKFKFIDKIRQYKFDILTLSETKKKQEGFYLIDIDDVLCLY